MHGRAEEWMEGGWDQRVLEGCQKKCVWGRRGSWSLGYSEIQGVLVRLGFWKGWWCWVLVVICGDAIWRVW